MQQKSRNRQFKDAIYEQFARIGKAISSPNRLELLDLLCQAPRTVETLAKETGLSVANTSQHLRTLHTARLVDTDKHGVYVTYRLADDEVCEFFILLRMLSEKRLAEITHIVREYFEHREQMDPMDKDGLMTRIQEGSVTVLDVRPPEEYQAGHISGAISIPLKELESRISELPQDQEIVAYCRGPYCVLSVEAVELLRAKGFRSVRLEESAYDWQRRGLSVEVGDTLS